MSKKIIAIIASSFYPCKGGLEKQALLLAKEFNNKGILNYVVTTQTEDLKSEENIYGIDVIRIGYPKIIKNLKNVFNNKNMQRQTWYEQQNKNEGNKYNNIKASFVSLLYNIFILFSVVKFFILHKNKIDVIICFSLSPFDLFFISISKLFNIKSIARAASSGKYIFVNVNSILLRKQILKADKFIAISRTIRDEIINYGINKDKIHLISNAVEIPDQLWEYNSRKKYSAIIVGNLSQQPLKGIDILFQAWVKVLIIYPDAILNLCGDGNQSALRNLAKELGIEKNVLFSGASNDVENELLNSKMFVLPSRIEGMSNALLEAMAIGMPCIATDISGNIDLINNNYNGLLVKSEDYIQLGQSICFILSHPDRSIEFGANARETIIYNHSTEVIKQKYIELINEI